MRKGGESHRGDQQLTGDGLGAARPGGTGSVAPFLQYEVREGREAGEVVVLPKAFIANCNGPFILQLNLFGEEQ